MPFPDKSYETISEILADSRDGGGRLVENPDFVVDGYPRSANTFLVTALNMSWPDMVVKSHGHDSRTLAEANGLVPVVSVIRNPIDAISSYAVHLSLYEPERVDNLALLLGIYGDIAKQTLDNPHVFAIPFEEVTSDVTGTLDLLEAKYELRNRVLVSREEIFNQTRNLSEQVNLTNDSFTKRGHVPRPLDPLYNQVKIQLQSQLHKSHLDDLNKIYKSIIIHYYQNSR